MGPLKITVQVANTQTMNWKSIPIIERKIKYFKSSSHIIILKLRDYIMKIKLQLKNETNKENICNQWQR